MPHPLAVGEIIEGKVYCKQKNQVSVNTAHWRVSSVAGVVDDTEMGVQLDTAVDGPVTALLASTAEYLGVSVQKIFPLPRTVGILNNTGAAAGAVSRPPLPAHICGLIFKRTGLAGPGFRGRVYTPFPSEVDNDDTTAAPTPTYRTALLAYAAALFGTFNLAPAGGGTATLIPVVYHADTNTVNDVTAFGASNMWANQTRRGDRGQPNKSPFD